MTAYKPSHSLIIGLNIFKSPEKVFHLSWAWIICPQNDLKLVLVLFASKHIKKNSSRWWESNATPIHPYFTLSVPWDFYPVLFNFEISSKSCAVLRSPNWIVQRKVEHVFTPIEETSNDIIAGNGRFLKVYMFLVWLNLSKKNYEVVRLKYLSQKSWSIREQGYSTFWGPQYLTSQSSLGT